MSGADSRDRTPPAWTRVYTYVFVGALVVSTVVLVVVAVTAEPGDRGGFIGMAVLVGALALAALSLVRAVERRLRSRSS